MKKLLIISAFGMFLFSCEKEEIRPNSELSGCYDTRDVSSEGKEVNSSIDNTDSTDPITDPNKDKDEGGRRKLINN